MLLVNGKKYHKKKKSKEKKKHINLICKHGRLNKRTDRRTESAKTIFPRFRPGMKNERCFGNSRRYCGKRRKCWLQGFVQSDLALHLPLLLNPFPNDKF